MDHAHSTMIIYPVTTALAIVLWIEVIVYLGTALYKTYDEFVRSTPNWTYQDGRLNTYIWYNEEKGYKAHTVLAAMLGIVALNGVLEGEVTRFEIEYIFLSLAFLSWMVFTIVPPNRVLMIKTMPIVPEFYLQAAMFILFYDWIRPEVLALCIAINLAGIAILLRRASKVDEAEYTIERFRADRDASKSKIKLRPFDPAAHSDHPISRSAPSE
ncbi:MAG: hypothetical protein AAGA72_05115 [Pseudomonadota bacterium]